MHQSFGDRIARQNGETVEDQIRGSREAIANLRSYLGCTASSEVLVQLLSDVLRARSGEVLFVPKAWLSDLCSNYAQVLPGFDDLPMHAGISMQSGALRSRAGEVEIRVSEAVACEDLCALFNLSETDFRMGKLNSELASERKTATALLRATATNAYRLLEAYLNGKAEDRLACDNGSLDTSERDLLTEWDSKRGRPQFLRLGDKITKYHALLGRDVGAAMDEETSSRVAHVVTLAADLRNPLVHPKPRSDLRESEPGRFEFIGDLEFEGVRELVLDVLAVIHAFETSVSGDTGGITLWFPTLGPDGRFGQEVFH